MVDIVGDAHAVVQAVEVVDGGEDVVHGDGAADEAVVVLLQGLLLAGLVQALVQNGAQLGKADLLVDAALGNVKAEEALSVHGAVGDDLDFLLVDGQVSHAHAGGLGGLGHLAGDLLAGGNEQLAGEGSPKFSECIICHRST